MPPDSYHQLPSAFKKRMTNINNIYNRNRLRHLSRSIVSGHRGMSRLHQCVQNVASNNIGAIHSITVIYCFSRLFQRAVPIFDVPKFKIAQVFKARILDPDSEIQLSYRLKST
ncbi:hypothetical protein T02_7948, partial [Trichinella nativa]